MRHGSWALAIAVFVVLLLLVPVNLAQAASAAAPPPSGGGPGTITETLALQPGNNVSANLFGVTISPRANLIPNEADLVDPTLDRTEIFPGAVSGDNFNPFLNASWTYANKNKTWYWQTAPTTVYQFAAWCRSINCTAIMQVPGEIDDPALAAEIVACTLPITPSSPNCTDPYNPTNTHYPKWGVTPAYWEIGNEPGLWTDWNQPWSQWCKACNNTTTPDNYATEVVQYIQNMTRVDPGIQIIGLPGLGKGVSGDSGTWIAAVIQAVLRAHVSASVAGFALHIYPAADDNAVVDGVPTLAQYYVNFVQNNSNSAWKRSYAQMNGPLKLSTILTAGQIANYTGVQYNGQVPLFITELGTSLSHQGFSPYSLTFPGGLAEAVEDIQELEFPYTKLSNTDLLAAVFDTNNSWFNLSGVTRPSYTIAAEVVNHLGTDAFPITTGNPNDTLSAIATIDPKDADRHDLLIVNTNVTDSVSFSTNFINSSDASTIKPADRAAAFSASAPVAEWTWAGRNVSYLNTNKSYFIPKTYYPTSWPSTPGPVFNGTTTGLPATVTLPPQSLALFETYNAPASAVTFSESSLNLSYNTSTPHWFLALKNATAPHGAFTNYTSEAPTLTVLLRPGTYTTASVPVLAPEPGAIRVPLERYAPTLPATVTVTAGTPSNVSVQFHQQWSVNVSWNASRGSVVAVGGDGAAVPRWWDNATPLTLQVVPKDPYAFTHWFGLGAGAGGKTGENGSVNGYYPTLTVDPTGPIIEGADLALGQPVYFTESGLPNGTPWNVTLAGFTRSGTGPTIGFNETEASWGYFASNVTGYYWIWWANRTVNVTKGVNQVSVDYYVHSPRFNVTFVESGLPDGAVWHMTFDHNASGNITSDSITYSNVLPSEHGGYAYNVSNEYWAGSGYRFYRPNGTSPTVFVPDANVTVNVTFEPLYPVTFVESGLAPGTPWTVEVAPTTVTFASVNTTAGTSMVVQLPDGSWGYHVDNVTGYWPVGGPPFNVTGGPVLVPVLFHPLIPPGPYYPVTFVAVGLPAATPWHVTAVTGVGNTSSASGFAGDPLIVPIHNGTHTFTAGAPGGYNITSNLTFLVGGGPLSVTVDFAPGNKVIWNETGIGAMPSWTVDFLGVVLNSSGHLVENRTFNGTDPYSIPVLQHAPHGIAYVPDLGRGALHLTGAGAYLHVVFNPATSPVTFAAVGLPSGLSDQIRLSNETLVSSASSTVFQLPNGSFTYDVAAPAGYFADPSHGALTIDGPMNVTVAILPVGRGPNPPFDALVLPAATTAIVLAFSGLGMFALLGAIRRRRTGAAP